jgi:transposase-like protein
MIRKSKAKDIPCPRCNQPRLIKSGFTTSKYGRWQRYKCLSCQFITTNPYKGVENKTVTVPIGSEVITVKRDAKGRFCKA